MGEVLHIDGFGNIVSNIPEQLLELFGVSYGDAITVRIGDNNLNIQFCSAYGNVSTGSCLALIGSGNLLEVAVNQGSASKIFKVNVGDVFFVTKA